MIASIARRWLRPSTYRKVRLSIGDIFGLVAHIAKGVRFGSRLAVHCRGRSGLLLNVGCGALVAPGWINLDADPRDGAFYYDALDPLPLASGAVRHIHCEHFLEHLAFDDARTFLYECYRVLERNGSIRIIVPDAEKYMRAYSAANTEFFSQLIHLGNSAEPLLLKNVVCNQAFRMGGGHLFSWDFETLESVAKKIGFDAARSQRYSVQPDYMIDGSDDWRPIESLYANLVKPF